MNKTEDCIEAAKLYHRLDKRTEYIQYCEFMNVDVRHCISHAIMKYCEKGDVELAEWLIQFQMHKIATMRSHFYVKSNKKILQTFQLLHKYHFPLYIASFQQVKLASLFKLSLNRFAVSTTWRPHNGFGSNCVHNETENHHD